MPPSTPAQPSQQQAQQQPQKKGVSAGLKNALKSAKILKVAVPGPLRRNTGKSTAGASAMGRGGIGPLEGEKPVALLKVQIVGCMHLLAKDRGGTSDPFVLASVLNQRHQTPVCKKTLNPTYAAKDATFEFQIYLSMASELGVLELVVWDKDMLGKDYLGEVALPIEEWFEGRPVKWDDDSNKPFSVDLESTREGTVSQGSVQIKLGFVPAPGAPPSPSVEDIYEDLVARSRPSLVSAPPTAGVGTIRASQDGAALEDDGGLSSASEDENDDDEEDDDDDRNAVYVDAPETLSPPALSPNLPPPVAATTSTASSTTVTPTPPSLDSKTPEAAATPPARPSAPTRLSSGLIPKMKLPKRLSSKGSASVAVPEVTTPLTASGASTPLSEGVKVKKQKKQKSEYQFEGGNDIVGIVMLEIQKAEDLPKLSNMTRTGWDMDPFVVISFGKKVFRTRVLRHSLNPVWDEKLLFHVRRYETAFKVQLAILDWDKLSSNDHIGDASFDVKDLLDSAPQPDPKTGLYDPAEEGNHPMKEMKLPLATAKGMLWESKHSPTIYVKAKYQPYDALRQQFWRQYLKQYDTDDTKALSHIELTSMLDSLGSTLTHSTISTFFTRFNKNPQSDELTFDEAILCLEAELGKPQSEKKRLDDDTIGDTSSVGTPVLQALDSKGNEIKLEELNFAGEGKKPHEREEVGGLRGPQTIGTSGVQQPLSEVAANPDSSDDLEEEDVEPTPTGATQAAGKRKKLRFGRKKKGARADNKVSPSESDAGSGSGSSGDEMVERIINVKNCPLCHRPRMNSKAEVDIITHLAVCASQDWKAVDKIMVNNFVTASQAQRKWYTKMISKVSAGGYKLGANSANIIVQNRMTGQLEEEKMQVYVRLGIRLLYKGASSRMEGARARKLLKSMSIKQGIKYDDPLSAREIPAFIEFHNLNVDEILDPLESFKTFNEFFYRKLKPSARPVESPEDPYRLVSSADCRFMAFESVSEATRLWIKGREFSVGKLLGEAFREEAERYVGGALAIFRLAPQDYHRFHSPVAGRVGKISHITGEYYTVNPQAIRTALDVYGDNVRKVVPIDSPQFGRVMNVCVGAMMVGSIQMTVKEGDFVERGQEYGYFAFGGSTIVTLFEKGAVQWDEDLLINGRASLETLVRVGTGIGKGSSGFKA